MKKYLEAITVIKKMYTGELRKAALDGIREVASRDFHFAKGITECEYEKIIEAYTQAVHPESYSEKEKSVLAAN